MIEKEGHHAARCFKVLKSESKANSDAEWIEVEGFLWTYTNLKRHIVDYPLR